MADGKPLPSTGDCVTVSSDIHDTDPTAVGTAIFQSKYTQPYSVRRAGRSRYYTLVLNGAQVGTIEQNGNWLIITLDGRQMRLRSDAPGVFI